MYEFTFRQCTHTLTYIYRPNEYKLVFGSISECDDVARVNMYVIVYVKNACCVYVCVCVRNTVESRNDKANERPTDSSEFCCAELSLAIFVYIHRYVRKTYPQTCMYVQVRSIVCNCSSIVFAFVIFWQVWV